MSKKAPQHRVLTFVCGVCRKEHVLDVMIQKTPDPEIDALVTPDGEAFPVKARGAIPHPRGWTAATLSGQEKSTGYIYTLTFPICSQACAQKIQTEGPPPQLLAEMERFNTITDREAPVQSGTTPGLTPVR